MYIWSATWCRTFRFTNWYGIHPTWLKSSNVAVAKHSKVTPNWWSYFAFHCALCMSRLLRSCEMKQELTAQFRMQITCISACSFCTFVLENYSVCGQSEFQLQRSPSWNTSLAWSVVYRVLRNVGWSCNLFTGLVIVPTEKWWRQRWGMKAFKTIILFVDWRQGVTLHVAAFCFRGLNRTASSLNKLNVAVQ